MKKHYETLVKERMMKKFPDELMGGLFHGKAYPHIFKELKDNFIDGSYPVQSSINEFFKHYQIRRNILYAKNKGDYVLFLTPRENELLNEGRAYIERYANEWKTSCIRNLYWEDLLQATLQVVKEVPVLLEYYTKFREKYFA